MLDSLAVRITLLWGWRRMLLAFLAGAASALAMPPWQAFPVLFITVPVLIWLLDGVNGPGRRRMAMGAALTGWAFGFGFFLAGLYWLGNALLVDARQFAWALPLAIALLPAALAVFPAAACTAARLLWTGNYTRIFALAVNWTVFEWLRGHVLTGLPWNLAGYGFSGLLPVTQMAAVTGIYGLSFLMLLLSGLPAGLAGGGTAGASPMRRYVPPLAALAGFALLWGAGSWRLARSAHGFVPGVNLRLVQPNIAQKDKWKPANRGPILARMLELSDAATSPDRMGIADVTLLIWPEVALPYLMLENADALSAIAALLPDKTHLVTGAIRREAVRGRDTPGSRTGKWRVYNSIIVLDGRGRTVSVYDKMHLVPFGEYLPFQDTLEKLGLRQLTGLPGGFTAGMSRPGMRAGVAPSFTPLICYEAIFPAGVASSNGRNGWMVNLTNDAWYGDTPGPRQHFQQVRMRAIEQGQPVIRVANTGISAVIDPYGRVLNRIGLGHSGVIDSPLPAALAPTLYSRFGDLVLLLLLLGPASWLAYRLKPQTPAKRVKSK